VTPVIVALARVVERRLRSSKRLKIMGRASIAALARVSSNARAFVRLRLMPIV
jgi:hypothetical protein